MTLPSRRKLRITRPNTPTSVDGSRATWLAAPRLALAALGVILANTGALQAAEPGPLPASKNSVAAPPLHGGHAPWTEPSASADARAERESAPVRRPAARRSSTAAAGKKSAHGGTTAKSPRRTARRTVQPVRFDDDPTSTEVNGAERSLSKTLPDWPDRADLPAVEELESSPPPAIRADEPLAQNAPYEPTPEPNGDDVEARRARLREQLTRPFKQMREIRPFYDYEPDSEQQAADRCYNLCPRPGSPDCPDCEIAGPDGTTRGGLPCPECPVEIDLRETSRLIGSVNDLPVRNFPHIHYCWEPTNLFSYPLYFEDHCLERYGHTRHFVLQAPVSVGLFAAQFLGLPYQMTIDPIAKKRYSLGWYRPGQYVPYKYYQVPWNTEAALVEAGAIAGGYFLFAPGVGP